MKKQSVSPRYQEKNGLNSERPGLRPRQQELLDVLFERGHASIEYLAEFFSVSRMTIHRDAHELTRRGLIEKNHGGISLRHRARTEKSVIYRQHRATVQKKAIIQRAIGMIRPGQVIILDDSTTVAEMLPLLPALAPLTVITYAVGVVQRLALVSGIKIICLGGEYSSTRNAFFGLICVNTARSLRAHLMFMSTSAVSRHAAFQNEQNVVQTKCALMDIADRNVLLVDSSKFKKDGLHQLSELKSFDHILTDHGLDLVTLQSMRAAKLPIETC